MDDFKEEERKNGECAWRGYVVRFSRRSQYIFIHNPLEQRLVHCKSCGASIPRTVPRLKISDSWNSYAGHYCLSCALKELDKHLEDKISDYNDLKENLQELRTIKETLRTCSEKEKYKDMMATPIMMSKLNPKRR